MTTPKIDRFSITGKLPHAKQSADIVVIGAGQAGVAAAIAAAQGGASVLLVDENPVSASLMGIDTPLYFGGRMSRAVDNKARMIEQVFASDPQLEVAFEAGVEVSLGVYAWGAFQNGPGIGDMPEAAVGLADEERSWMVAYKQLILATGSRDLSLSFQGWDQPGVMGANGLHTLIKRYDAFAGSKVLILGSGDLALKTALMVVEAGLKVAALVEVRDHVQGDAALASAVRGHGIEILTGQVIVSASGGADGVEQATVVPVAGGEARSFDCDTVCQAIGVVPAIELFNVLGGKLSVRSDLGGHVPQRTGAVSTGLANVLVTGDCAGLGTDDAAAHGRAAAALALAGLAGKTLTDAAAADAVAGFDAHAYHTDWMAALLKVGDDSIVVCQCEEVTRGDLTAVRQPRYLGPPSTVAAKRDIVTLAADGPLNQDQFKRLTRACMGQCQARRCREQVALILAQSSNVPVATVPLAGYRAPVRPLPMSVLAADDEPSEMTADWDVWFGIPTQWIPYDDIGSDREPYHIANLTDTMHI
jgi:thioredoxin reductase